jgi:uncharacterized protein (DUF697 family)
VTSFGTGYEYENPAGEWETEQGEQELFGELVTGETGGGHDATQEMELAGELLEVTSEAELEEFLGNLIGRAVKGVKNFARSGVGQALIGGLKNVAKSALPIVGGALGSVVPGVGTALGSTVGSMASNLFELELESMNEEEAEFAVAQEIVRMGTRAARTAASAPRNAPPRAVAQAAIVAATPGLRRSSRRRRPRPQWRPGRPWPPSGYAYPVPYPTSWSGGDGGTGDGDGDHDPDDGGSADTDGTEMDTSYPGHAGAGRWVRRGRTIVLHGV